MNLVLLIMKDRRIGRVLGSIEYEKNFTIEKSYKPYIGGKIVVGIDEAGRGPVLGHLVYSAYITAENFAYADSKTLSPMQREQCEKKIRSESYVIKAMHPRYLSLLMEKYSLNAICYRIIKDIVDEISGIYRVDMFYIDTVGTCAALKKYIERSNVEVSIRADSKYPSVGGASILAKTTRDRLMTEFWRPKNEYGNIECLTDLNFGSGYPSDPKTISWLSNNKKSLEFLEIVRYRWKSISNIVGYEIFKSDVHVNSSNSLSHRGKHLKKKSQVFNSLFRDQERR